MYEEFYGLSGKPFQLNPDPRFFFSSIGHKRAMAYMHYGLQQEQGFIVVTGDVGTGKSMLVSNLFSTLDKERLVAAKLASTNVHSADLIRLICDELGLPHQRRAKATLLSNLEDYFREMVEAGKHVLLVVDEAQNLPRESLEELRMLSNFEHDSKPLVQSFLLGQREFRRILRAPGLEQLRQRVIAAYHLGPLDEKEIAAYVRHRLKVAGWRDDPVLEEGLFERVFMATGGIPRRINTFFDRLLLNGYLDETHVLTVKAAEQVAQEVEQEIRGPEPGEATDEYGIKDVPVNAEQPPVPIADDKRLIERLDRMERQLTALSSQLSEGRRSLPDDDDAVPLTPPERPESRWTLAFVTLSIFVVALAVAATYLVMT